jgi:L-alanine-DL-glutamate epimerase-like enolase superfamily enzyme
MSHASPDGLVGDEGLIEIKCPNSGTHIETLLGSEIDGKYIKQMQWQMACTDRQWCDFVSYDPRFPEPLRLFRARAFRKEDEAESYGLMVRSFLGEVDKEIASIEALAKAVPGVPLRIDPNANWTVATSLKVVEQLRGVLEYCEDPAPGLEGMAEVARQCEVPLATNMVVTDLKEFRRNVEMGCPVKIVLSDHHYWGGMRATQRLATMCQTFGLGVSMHSNSHLGISLMAMTHLAASVPQLSYACDTHYPWQDDEVVQGGRIAFVLAGQKRTVRLTRAHRE